MLVDQAASFNCMIASMLATLASGSLYYQSDSIEYD